MRACVCTCLHSCFSLGVCCFGGEQLLTFALTVAVVVLAYVVSRGLQTVGVWATAVFIAAVDVLLPSLVRLFCCLERHHNAVTHDLSVMNKVCFVFVVVVLFLADMSMCVC